MNGLYEEKKSRTLSLGPDHLLNLVPLLLRHLQKIVHNTRNLSNISTIKSNHLTAQPRSIITTQISRQIRNLLRHSRPPSRSLLHHLLKSGPVRVQTAESPLSVDAARGDDV